MDFFENEAEESDLTSGGDLSASDEEAEIKPKRRKKEKKKKVRARIEDDDDEEEEEEEGTLFRSCMLSVFTLKRK